LCDCFPSHQAVHAEKCAQGNITAPALCAARMREQAQLQVHGRPRQSTTYVRTCASASAKCRTNRR
jgi:hypothetical protein